MVRRVQGDKTIIYECKSALQIAQRTLLSISGVSPQAAPEPEIVNSDNTSEGPDRKTYADYATELADLVESLARAPDSGSVQPV